MAFPPRVQIILKVYLDAAAQRLTEVPITPHTTVTDVLQCCREPGEDQCHLAELWRGIERPVMMNERPYEILQQWGIHRDEVRFYLRHEPVPPQINNNQGRTRTQQPTRNGMMSDGINMNIGLPHGVDLTLSELQEMTARQQQQIEAQQQLLVAKEQRLRFLKQQELRHEQIAAENERLRKLREKVEAQELKLKKLRVSRGQVSDHKGNNNNLTAELEMIKTLFNEKEKELSIAVTKVEDLTKQLEELRNGHINGQHTDNRNSSPAFLELDKLRKELMMRNKLNEAQNSKLAAHREVMQQRKEEMGTMDIRIAELQQRLRKNRNLQQQQQQHKEQQQVLVGQRSGSMSAKIGTNRPLSANIAAVEPYIKHGSSKDNLIDHQNSYGISKHDPKYQTLPPNIKLLGLEGKKYIDAEPNGNGIAPTTGRVHEHIDNINIEKNNNIQSGDFKIDTGNQGIVASTQGRASPVKNSRDMLSREMVPKVAEFKPSKGHMTAFAVMEEVLKKSGDDGGGSSALESSGPVNVPPRNIYGPMSYKPPASLANFTARPFGSTYSTAMFTNRPNIISTQANQSSINTSNNVVISSPGALYPKTSTPMAGGQLANNQDETREIFITGAPMSSSSVSNIGRTSFSNIDAGSTIISHSIPNYHPLSISTSSSASSSANLSAGGIPDVSPRQYDSTKPLQYQIASSRPQQAMHPQRASDAPSPQSNQPTRPPSVASSVLSFSGISSKVSSSSSNSPNIFSGRPSFNNNSESQAAITSQLGASTKTTFSESHTQGLSSTINLSGNTQPVNSINMPRSEQVATPTGNDMALQQSQKEASRSGQLKSGNQSETKKDITANSVSSALSVLMSGPSTTVPASRPFRYAPKSVIANTYMRKLGNNTLETYRKTMNQVYKDFGSLPVTSSSSDTDKDVKAEKTDQPEPYLKGGEPDVAEGPRANAPAPAPSDALTRTSTSEAETDISGEQPQSPSRVTLPPYTHQTSSDIEAERIRYKPNAPKTLRRRLSSGESDDLSNFLPKPHQASSVNAKDSGPPLQQNVVRLDTIQQDSYNNNKMSGRLDSPVTVYNIPHGDGQHIPEVELAPTTKPNKAAAVCRKKTNLKTKGAIRAARSVSFDPLALLLDASLEGELELVMRTAREVSDASAANDEGITALHNAICANHFDIVRFLTEFGCNVNAPDSDGWTPLHCAASCNNLAMVKLLVEHGACIFATTISDNETAAEKCEEDEDGYDGCSEYLYSIQEKLGIGNKGVVFAVFDYNACNPDELSFKNGNNIMVLRKGDEQEKDWWWARRGDREGYIPRNLLGSCPRVQPENDR